MTIREQISVRNSRDERKPERNECWRCYNDLTEDDITDDYYVCPYCGECGKVRRTYTKSYYKRY